MNSCPSGNKVHTVPASGTLLAAEVAKIHQQFTVGLCVFPQQRLLLGAVVELMIDVGINVQGYRYVFISSSMDEITGRFSGVATMFTWTSRNCCSSFTLAMKFSALTYSR